MPIYNYTCLDYGKEPRLALTLKDHGSDGVCPRGRSKTSRSDMPTNGSVKDRPETVVETYMA